VASYYNIAVKLDMIVMTTAC